MSYDFWNKKYSEEELREYIERNSKRLDYWFWTFVSTYQNLSEDFIRDFQNNLFWWEILTEQSLSEEFLIEFIERINTYAIAQNKKIPEDVKNRIKNLKKLLETT